MAQQWRDTAVLPPRPAAIPAGWYADPYDPARLRYFDGAAWSSLTAEQHRRPRARRSVAVALLLALLFGGLALPYALPLPGWARLLLAVLILVAIGWWALILVPLSWPFAVVGVPLLTALLNRR